MTLFVVYVFPFFEMNFLERVPRSESVISMRPRDVQRETKRKHVKRQMRAHIVAEQNDIQQKIHRKSFRLWRADFVPNVGSTQDF